MNFTKKIHGNNPLGIFNLNSWILYYDKNWLRADILAGLTVWGMIIPEVIAYAVMAGLPPQAGIYTVLAALLVYIFFGSSRHLIVTTTSAAAILLAATIIDQNPADTAVYLSLATAIVFLVGIFYLISAVIKLGFITQFISRPVMKGFFSGLAIYIIINQLPKIFGIERISGSTIDQLGNLFASLGHTNFVTLLISVSALGLLYILGSINKRIPVGLLALALGIAASAWFGLGEYGVKVVGEINAGLPVFVIPHLKDINLWILVPGAVGIALVVYSESLGAAEALADKHNYEINSNKELFALSLANLGSSMFGGLIAGGSMSQTATAESAGAKSQMTSLVALILSFITIIAFSLVFKNLPQAILASIIIFAVSHLVKFKDIRLYYKYEKIEFILCLIAFFGVLFIGVLKGLIIAMALSLVWFIYKSIHESGSVLGISTSIPGRYVDIKRHSGCKTIPGLIIYRVNSPIYYANAKYIIKHIENEIDNSEHLVRALALDLGVNDYLDITSAEELKKLFEKFKSQNINLFLIDVHAPVIKIAKEIIGSKYLSDKSLFANIDIAVDYYKKSKKEKHE